MGKKSRARRAGLKLIMGEALKKAGIDVPVPVALKLLRGGKAAVTPRMASKLQDLGYKENEFGELVSTIKKLSEHEIIERMCARAKFEIQSIEDAHVFAQIEEAIAGVELGA